MQSAAVFFVLHLAMPLAHGQAPHAGLKDVPVDGLKKLYLSCDRAVAQGQLAPAGIMQCSVIYEELKLRAFGGDFARLHAWSRAQSPARDATR